MGMIEVSCWRTIRNFHLNNSNQHYFPPAIEICDVPANASCASFIRNARSTAEPSLTIEVLQLKANRIEFAQVSPNASPGALPRPLAANAAESSSALLQPISSRNVDSSSVHR